MSTCDLCNGTTSRDDATVYSAGDFRLLVANGLEPPPVVTQVATALGLSKEAALAQWKEELVAQSTTDWVLCRACASVATNFLPKTTSGEDQKAGAESLRGPEASRMPDDAKRVVIAATQADKATERLLREIRRLRQASSKAEERWQGSMSVEQKMDYILGRTTLPEEVRNLALRRRELENQAAAAIAGTADAGRTRQILEWIQDDQNLGLTLDSVPRERRWWRRWWA